MDAVMFSKKVSLGEVYRKRRETAVAWTPMSGTGAKDPSPRTHARSQSQPSSDPTIIRGEK